MSSVTEIIAGRAPTAAARSTMDRARISRTEKAMRYDPYSYRFGIEFEYQLTDVDGRPLHHRELSFAQLKSLIAQSGAPTLDYLAMKYPGSAQRSYYLEGYDLFDESGTFAGLDVKGIEISTPIAPDVFAQQEQLVRLYNTMQLLLAGVGLSGSCYGAHQLAADDEYRGPRGSRSVEGWAAAETAMTTWGIHVNVSFPDEVEQRLDRECLQAKFDYFAPALVLLSADTPVRGCGAWTTDGVVGKSERSYRRSFTRRPLYFRDDQHFRKEITCFDVTNRLALIRGYTAISAGLMLENGDVDYLPGTFADHNMRQVSVHGYGATILNRHFQPLAPDRLVHEALDRAAKGLAAHGLDTSPLNSLRSLADRRRCPADDTVEAWQEAGDWPSFLLGRRNLIDGADL